MSDKLETLKQEATELGVTFSPNIGEAKLQEKIDAYYESQETSGKELEALVKVQDAKEQSEENSAVKRKKTMYEKAAEAEREARKTRVVTIVDNDQRENNHTSSVTVSCGNSYFDLGTVILPLNTPVEVKMGHIQVLKELMIPQHVVDSKTQLSKVVRRKRYSVSFEDMQ